MKISLLFVVVVWSLQVNVGLTQTPEDIDEWAYTFGKIINAAARNAMALRRIQWGYFISDLSVKPLNGTSLLLGVKSNLETIFSSRLRAIQNLTDIAETTYANYQPRTHFQYPYYKSKNLSASFNLSSDPYFPGILINTTYSTVHVPTNVYDESDRILNGVRWSSVLDKVFVFNKETSPFISYQFFGSSDGFYRNYPGIKWVQDGPVDLYDCRRRGWYIKAATSTKDVVMLVDTSGSMRGLRMHIATSTIFNIIKTLNEDDFFNIIKYSEEPEYLDECFNGTLVQATVKNLKRIRSRLNEGIKTLSMANLEKALVTAFELFEKASLMGLGSRCNRVIMIITDGASSKFQEVFKKYNWPEKRIRVFTYMIGREAKDSTNLRWIACNNKGYFSHISTLADIHEHVQDYIRVLGRPLAINRSRQFIWTNIYANALAVSPENSLTTTLAVPVYDFKNDTKAFLLGVMGTDIELSVLTNTLPKHQLGVHSYAFAVTNNGYVIFHPNHRPFNNGKLLENFNSLDISEVEFIDDGNATIDRKKLKLPIRQHMIRREMGLYRLSMKVAEDNMRRVSIRDTTFYYIPVNNTPFSLGVAVPDGHSQNYLDGRVKLKKADLKTLEENNILLAPWRYCWPRNQEDAKLSEYSLLIKYLEIFKDDPALFAKHCYNDLVESLLFDADATKNALIEWTKQSKYRYRLCIGRDCSTRPIIDSVELVFIGTKAGLTRYYNYTSNLSDPDFLTRNAETNKMLYYTRAIENGDGVLTVSVPFHDHKGIKMVTMSKPVIANWGGKTAAAGVLGLQMKYSAFHEYFIKAGNFCLEMDNCKVDCTLETIDCYMLDNNAYVVFSEKPEEHLGKFFGEIDGALMEEISTSDIHNITKLFRSVSIVDFQATCKKWTETKSSGYAFSITPFTHLKSILVWFSNKLIMFLIYFFSVCCLDILNVDSEEVTPSPDFLSHNELKRIFWLVNNDTAAYSQHIETYRLMTLRGENQQTIIHWYSELLKRLAAPTFELCSKLHRAYVLQKNASQLLPLIATLPQNCSDCSHPKNFSVRQIPETNLLLVTVQSVCDCSHTISLESVEIPSEDSDSCDDYYEQYRRRPKQCFAYHPDENSTLCEGCFIQPTCSLILITILINIIIV